MKLQACITICCIAILLASGPAGAQQNRQKKSGRAVLTIPEVEKKDIICFALYTVHDNTLKLTAQLYPLADGDSRTVRLEIKKGDQGGAHFCLPFACHDHYHRKGGQTCREYPCGLGG